MVSPLQGQAVFQQREQTLSPPAPDRRGGRGSWAGRVTLLPPARAGLSAGSSPAGPVMSGTHCGAAVFWVLRVPFQTKCDKKLLYKE